MKENFLKKFQKTLDKQKTLWYNKQAVTEKSSVINSRQSGLRAPEIKPDERNSAVP